MKLLATCSSPQHADWEFPTDSQEYRKVSAESRLCCIVPLDSAGGLVSRKGTQNAFPIWWNLGHSAQDHTNKDRLSLLLCYLLDLLDYATFGKTTAILAST